MKILVTGSKGQLGKAISEQFKDEDLILTDKNELDISNFTQVHNNIKCVKPSVIINCAAFTNVDACELHKSYAFDVNTVGTYNIAISAEYFGCELVHISTDYVFDGEGIFNEGKVRPYEEDDKTNPLTIYGISKRLGECLLEEIMSRYYLIRTSWLYGDGENFVNCMIKKGQEYSSEARVIIDQRGTPTSTEQLASLIGALLKEKAYGLYHGSCEGDCSRYELTQYIYNFLGINKHLVPITSNDLEQVVKRPAYSVLENKKLKELGIFQFSHWEEALSKFLLKQQ